MKHIILDFDNTMGVQGCDVDDFLALLYLLGNPELCEVEALCTAFGNSSIDVVHANTLRLVDELGLDLPVYRGAAAAGDADTEAARFLSRAAAERSGYYDILVTGSTANLSGAVQADPRFFENVAGLTFMGGITHSIAIHGHIMNELNLSSDPEATYAAFASGADCTVAVSQSCLPALVDCDAFARVFNHDSWLTRNITYWYADMAERYEWEGFVVWDQVAAAMLIKPELFEPCDMNVTLDERFFSIGFLEEAVEGDPAALIHTPVIADVPTYIEDALEGWKRGCERLGLSC